MPQSLGAPAPSPEALDTPMPSSADATRRTNSDRDAIYARHTGPATPPRGWVYHPLIATLRYNIYPLRKNFLDLRPRG
jgi:hypothetical protein